MRKKKNVIYNVAVTALFVAIIVVSAWASLPLGSVPVTLQTVGVFSAVALLGFKRGFAATVIYILLGIVGLPVFHGFQGGFGVLLSSTGGFIWGFLLATVVIALLYNKNVHGLKRLTMALLLAQIACYFFGTLWFLLAYSDGQGIIGVLAVSVLPFILPDALKITATVFLVKRAAKYVK